MSIVTSEIIEDSAQADGRRYIRERYTDHLSGTHDVVYLAEAGADITAAMEARATLVEEGLKEAEIQANIAKALEGKTNFTTQHSTGLENRLRTRAAFKAASKFECITLAWVIHELNWNNAQLKAAFGIEDAQIAALRAKLLDLHEKYIGVAIQQGE